MITRPRARLCRGDSLDLDSAKAGDYYKNGPYAHRYTLHLAAGTVDKECLTAAERQRRCEFPVVAGAAYGHKQRHAYAASYQAEEHGDGGIDECAFCFFLLPSLGSGCCA